MSKDEDKFKHSKRLQKDENTIKKQTRIAKSAGLDITEPHKFAKHHAVNCGNSNCVFCSNSRKIFKELTQQEKRLFQDVDRVSNRRSNGLNTTDE